MRKIYKENGNLKEKFQSVNCNLQYSQFTNSIVAMTLVTIHIKTHSIAKTKHNKQKNIYYNEKTKNRNILKYKVYFQSNIHCLSSVMSCFTSHR